MVVTTPPFPEPPCTPHNSLSHPRPLPPLDTYARSSPTGSAKPCDCPSGAPAHLPSSGRSSSLPLPSHVPSLLPVTPSPRLLPDRPSGIASTPHFPNDAHSNGTCSRRSTLRWASENSRHAWRSTTTASPTSANPTPTRPAPSRPLAPIPSTPTRPPASSAPRTDTHSA